MFLPDDDDALYNALIARDPAYEGFAYVGVRSTGVFCRLTCPARKPKRANVLFFRRVEEAQEAGFRPCLRCRPLDNHFRTSGALDALRERVRAEPQRRWTSAALTALGHDSSTVRRAFKREYGVTFAQFARSQRVGHAVASLRNGARVIEAQLDAGYQSGSGFREAVNALVGEAPARTVVRRILTAQWLDTPIGAMLAVVDDAGVHLLEFADRAALPTAIARLRTRLGPVCFGHNDIMAALTDQVTRYFSGTCTSFSVPVVQTGTPFERAVWAELRRIPSGRTRSYAEVARSIDRPTAVRAVARANGANRVAIVIPCHRVIGSDGSLVGYGGKLWRKKWLIEHEHRLAAADNETKA
jgi:AraC family transcriptional regulator, regulatory protein of adaptative response / methylated-DNA-[protein]-cysteine methyltransferase